MRTLTNILFGLAIVGCGAAPQESEPESPRAVGSTASESQPRVATSTNAPPELIVDQTSRKDFAALIHQQALARVAAANKVTVAEVESKIAAGDAEMTKAVDEAKEVERRGFTRWQSAKTIKFVGALELFMREPLVEGVGNPNTAHGSTPMPRSAVTPHTHPVDSEPEPQHP